MQRITVGALVAVFLLAGGLVVLPYFVSEHQIRAAVTRSLVAATGVEPQIAGEARLAMLPRPAIRLNDVRLGDGRRPGFSAGTLQATVRILPLLLGRVEVASLTFERPRLSIEIGGDGAAIVGLPLRSPANSTENPDRPELRIVDGIVELSFTEAERRETFSAVEASLAWTDSSLTATGSLLWRNVPTNISLLLADTNALGRGGRSGLRLRLEAESLRVGFDGGLAFRNGIQADGALAAESHSLRAALAWFSLVPPTRGGFGPFKLKAQAALTSAALALTGLSIELDGNRAEGGLTLKRDGSRPVLQGTLAGDAANFTPYSGGFAVIGEDGRDWSREPIDLDALDAFDLDLRLSAGRVVVGKTELAHVAIAAVQKGGRFTVSVGEAKFYEGALRGTMALGRGGAGPEVKIEANISNFDLERGLGELAGIRRLEGKGTLGLVLEGAGPSVHAIVRALSGQATLTASNGSLNGINVEQVLRRLEHKPLSGAADFRGGRTSFERLMAKLRITRGTARVEEAQVDSPQVRVTLAGEASIANRDLDLKGTASLVRQGGATGAPQVFELPFIVQGSWDKPFLLPDPTALIQRSGAAAPLLDAVRKQIAREKTARSSIEPIAGALTSPGEDPRGMTAAPTAVRATP
jgi:AsmA protein